MAKEINLWSQNEAFADPFQKVPMVSTMDHVSPSAFSKRKFSGQEKPRKILRTGTRAVYEVEDDQEVQDGCHVQQNFLGTYHHIAGGNATQFAKPQVYRFGNPVLERVQLVPLQHSNELRDTNHVMTESSREMPTRPRELETSRTAHEKNFQNSDTDESTEEPCLGPRVLGLVPVQRPVHSSSSPSPDDQCCRHGQLEDKISSLEQQLTLLRQNHDLLRQSHEKLAQLVEAQNHLLACHTAPPPTREALSTFPTDESEYIQESDHSPEPTPVPESPTFLHDKDIPVPNQHYKLPRKVSARDIIRLWEEGNKSVPPVKNWSPGQKMQVQSKLSRWKKIIDIYKGECNGDMETFEQKYASDGGELLPVTTILALHENQLSSEFLSKGFCNTKLDTMVPSRAEIKHEYHATSSDVDNEESTSDRAVPMVKEENVNRYVLPRKVSARDVVQLWDSGCEDFPAIGEWTKAQKIGQETKIFRWKKIVDIFKKDCNSDWAVFTERYSNEKGELLPLATILAKHDAMYAQEQLTIMKQTADSQEPEKTPPKTPTTPIKTERLPRDPDSITLPRKVTAFEVVRYWIEGSDTFGPVKDWTRAQKMGQETKISRWKKIYEIFRYQCYRDWEEFCRRYTNQRGELLPIATILAKYEAENPAGAPNYQMYGAESPGISTPNSHAPNGEANRIGLESLEPTKVVVPVNDKGEYVLPKKLAAVDALSLWEHGTEEVPPMKTWTAGQVVQKTLLNSVQQVVQIFEQDCGGHYRRFLERFSDANGELLPISGIVYSSESRKYSPYFTVYEKSIKQSRSRGEQYELPKRVSAKEIVWLWEHGCSAFPPVKTWSSAQKLRYTTKLSRWRKIVEIFHMKCDSNWRVYEEKYSNASGELLAISTVISMQDDTDNDSYASMIKKSNSPEPNRKIWPIAGTSKEMKSEKPDGKCDGEPSSAEGSSYSEVKDEYAEFYLPRKVNALDIINFWENGFGNMPPVAQWSPLQKFRQRSKISRWNKIYDIYKNHCKGNIVEFEQLYSDKQGQLLPATTIISMYESRVDADSCNGEATTAELPAPGGPVVRRYMLPRKVDAKDIVKLWTKGNDEFPPIRAWSKADKIGQETKIFRWKKIVDIFMNHCGGDWTIFEELFSNEYGELLPTSVIIAKYETTCSKDQ